MPLTPKGQEILGSMEKTYGSEKKAEQVLYASKNAGTIAGIDEARVEKHSSMLDESLPKEVSQQQIAAQRYGTFKQGTT